MTVDTYLLITVFFGISSSLLSIVAGAIVRPLESATSGQPVLIKSHLMRFLDSTAVVGGTLALCALFCYLLPDDLISPRFTMSKVARALCFVYWAFYAGTFVQLILLGDFRPRLELRKQEK